MPTPPPWWTLTHVAPGCDVDERVQDRPVRDRVRAVAHRLGLAVRRRDRAGVEVVATDDHRRRHRAGADELVDRKARARAIAVTEPADPGGKTLEGDAAGRELEPALEQHVVREQRGELAVDHVDVRRISGEHRPSKRADPPAEERPDVRGDEAGIRERILETRVRGLAAQVVAVVEHVTARARELGHRAHVRDDRLARQAQVRLGIAHAQRLGLLDRHLGGHVARERIVRGRLVGDEVEVLAARSELREDAGRVREQARRTAPALRPQRCEPVRARRRASPRPRPGSASRAAARSGSGRPRRRGSPRPPSSPRAAGLHPSHRGRPSGWCGRSDQPSRSAALLRRRTSGTSPAGFPASRCRSSCRPSSGRTSSAPPPRAGGTRPRSPSAGRGASSR